MADFYGFSIIDIITISISTLAIIISVWDRISNNLANQKSDKKAEKALKLAQGVTEIEIRNSISQARHRVDSFAVELKKFKIDNPTADLSSHQTLFYSILEDFINQYDRACMLYLDNKIDKKRFKKEYKKELVNLVENGKYKNKYFSKKNLRFESIISVYKKFKK
ncbi:hypothetical protein ML462_15385 [Gramella lutea]|uniref:Uncharacterized protein n=1 Tax=Christiangramia lutea TaxID=1607951 RepID=A0A9X1V649_9FLAO|nr:hypothetical protein [Christiangramia lutea]MCH4824555.1 hypothetical protein [Christiangramia lutea]